jgi:hypothetical protein
MNKAELIEAIRSERAELEALWAGATEEQMTRRPGPQADWSVKDLIAHLVSWEQKLAGAIQSGRWAKSTGSGCEFGQRGRLRENRDRRWPTCWRASAAQGAGDRAGAGALRG